MTIRFNVGDRVAKVTRPFVGGSISAIRQYPMPLLDPTAGEPFAIYEVDWEDGFAGVVADDALVPCRATRALTEFALAQEAAIARLQPAVDDARALGRPAELALWHIIDAAQIEFANAQARIQDLSA